jgi:enoyl-CoA hydratase/carnithine racemase
VNSIGPSRGRYFLLTGQKLTARQALAMGVVSEVLPKRKQMQRARQLARQVCKQPPLARRFARAAVTQGLKRAMLDDLGYGLALEGLAAAQQMVSRK